MMDENSSIQREEEIKTAVQKMGYVMVPKVVLYDPVLSEKELLVYIALLSRDWTKSRQCFPSIATISKESGVSVSSVKRALDGLIEKKFLAKEHRTKESGALNSNLYILRRLDDIYCPANDYMSLSEEYQQRMKDNKKSYLVERVFNPDINQNNDSEEDTEQDRKLKMAQEEANKKTDRLCETFNDVDEKATEARNRRDHNKALRKKFGTVRKETEDPASIEEEKPEHELNVYDVEAFYRGEELAAFPDSQYSGRKWKPMDYGIAKKLKDEYGAENLMDVIEDVFRNWEDYKQRYRIPGYPSMKLFAYWAESWFNDVDMGKDRVRSNRDRAIAQGEYDGVEDDISYADFR